MILATSSLIATAIDEGEGELDGLRSVALRLEARAPAPQLVERLAHHGQIGARLSGVELDQNLACRNPLAIMDTDGTDDAARRVLDLLRARLDDELTMGDDGAGELRASAPSEDGDQEHHGQTDPGAQVASQRPLQVGLRKDEVGHWPRPASATMARLPAARAGAGLGST